MRTNLRQFSVLTALALLAAPGLAQARGGGAPASSEAVDKALSRWHEARDGDSNKRYAALQALASHDDPRVTEALVEELRRLGRDFAAIQVADALGKKVRAGALEPLLQLFGSKESMPAVRGALARAIANQGNQGVDALIDVATDKSGKATEEQRLAAVGGLAARNEDRAWRGIAPLALEGNSTQQLAMLRQLAPAKDVKAVTQVRIKLLSASDQVLAATAWRQLAAEKYPKAAQALDDVIEKLGASPQPAAVAEIVFGLGAGVPANRYDDFLRIASDPSPMVQAAVGAVAADLAKDHKLVQWLLTAALGRAEPAQRLVVLAIATKAAPEAVQPLVPKIRQGLQKPTRETVELALATLPALQKDPAWGQDVRRMLETSDEELRTTGLSLLFEMEQGDAVPFAQKQVGAKTWQLRSAAYRYLTKYRDLSSVAVLIERWGKEDGRLAAELSEALFVHAGIRCWSRDEWDDWWKKSKVAHALPQWESVKSKKGSGGGSTAAYYGIPLLSKRSVFLIDTSGSMSARIGTTGGQPGNQPGGQPGNQPGGRGNRGGNRGGGERGGRTRLDEVKRQLYAAVEKLPDEQLFNIYFYAGQPNPMWPQLQKAVGEDRKAVLDRIQKTDIGAGGTNIFDSLERAFADPEVDTVYLLSDGEPSAGRITDPNQIAEQVKRWNYGRQVVIHCVAVGSRSPLLERLAKESGGEYVFVQ